MNIQVNFVGTAPRNADGVAEETKRRVSLTFDHLAHSISHVQVTFRDVNGPRGGVDQECLVAVTPLASGRPVVARALGTFRDESMFKSLKRARRRFERAHVGKRRTGRSDSIRDNSPLSAEP